MKKSAFILLILMSVFDILPGFSQAPDWTRMLQTWTYGLQMGNALDADSENVYMAGTVSGPVTFEGINCTSIGTQDMILTKYTTDGLSLWTKQFNAQAGGSITPYALKVDANKNIVVSGSFQGTLTIGNNTFTSSANANEFIARFDANGNCLWASSFASTGTGFSRLAFDENGNCFLIARSSKLLKFSAKGEQQWEQVYEDGTLQAIAVSGSNLYLGGTIKGNVNFGSMTLSPSGLQKTGFLIRADLNGVYNHSMLAGGESFTRNSLVTDIIIDQSGNLVITGVYSRQLFLGTQQLVQNTSGYFTFIAKCNTDFDFTWAKSSSRIVAYLVSSRTYRLFKDEANNYYEYGAMNMNFTYGSISVPLAFGEFLVKFDENGNELKYYIIKNTTPNTIIVTQKGKFITTGSINYESVHSFGNLYLTQYNDEMNLDWQKVSSDSQSGTADINNVKHDSEGNTYLQSRICGYCNYFGNILQTNNPVTVISKHNIAGNLLWMNQIEDINPNLYGSTFTLDKDNNVLTTGFFDVSLTIGTTTLTNLNGSKKSYVAKYNSNGEFMWASGMNNPTINQLSLTTDHSGNVLVSAVNLPSNYLTKFDASGHLLWEKSFPMESYYSSVISTDGNNNIYLTSEIRLSDNEGSTTIGSVTLNQSKEDGATALLKFDPDGNALWAKTYGGVMGASFSEGWPCHLKTDATGNSYIWGICVNNSIFGTTTLTNPFETAYHYFKYLAKINTSGEIIWANAIYDKGYAFNYGDLLDLDKNGNVYVGGSFKDSISISDNLYKPEGSFDFFVAKYTNEGDFQWIKTIPSDTKIINALNVLDNDNLTIAGAPDKHTTLGTFPYIKNGNSTAFVATLGDLPTGTNNISSFMEKGNIHLYPNPNHGKFHIDFKNLETVSQTSELQILNMMGQSVYSTRILKLQMSNELDLSGAPKGIYFLKVHMGGKIYTKKIVIN